MTDQFQESDSTTMPGTTFLIKLKGFNSNKRILRETTNILKRKIGV